MKKTLIATVMASLALVACNNEEVSQKLKAAEEKANQLAETLSAKDINLSQLQQSYEKLKEEFDSLKASVTERSFPSLEVKKEVLFSKEETVTENGPGYTTDIQVSAQSIQTEFDWLNQIVLRYLLAAAQDDTEEYQNLPEFATKEQVKDAFHKVFQNFRAQLKEMQPPELLLTADMRYLGQKGSLVFFALDTLQSEGGAHGIFLTRYITVDADSKKVLALDDLFTATGLSEIKNKLWDAYQERLQTNNTEATVTQQEFRVSPNFYFGPEGLVFVYAPYSLASYAEGPVELTVYYPSLEGLLNKKYQQ